MTYHKLRFTRKCSVKVDGKQIETRVVYAGFPYGYGRDYYLIPAIVIDRNGTTYRPLDICGNNWAVADNGYLKRIGLTRKQVGGTA